ncbi:MAG: RecQ family ATP-dependent DNA helicase, partial [Treponemataceae bacterium]|nr:RecQ family ATP-dependent DNA helicase [Treponemataceae bacterium]
MNNFQNCKPELVLKKAFGYDSFRPLQKEIIENVLSGKDTLAVMPTGGGKSLCYQIPALILEGITIIVSPLISLMQDQVSSLQSNGIECVFLNSSLNREEYFKTVDAIKSGAVKILYISPEGLATSRVRDILTSSELSVSLITIDEAHCISEWGHDFRPDYLEIRSIRGLFPKAHMLALTATATQQVRKDIIKNLAMKKPDVFVSSFNRENIYLEVQP